MKQVKLTETQLRDLVKESITKLVNENNSMTDDIFEELYNIIDQDVMNITNKACNFMESKGFGQYKNLMQHELYNELFDTLDVWFTNFTER